MVRSIVIFLLFTVSTLGKNRIVYTSFFDSLLTVSPNRDSIESVVNAMGIVGDTTHLVAFNDVVGLQDTINAIQTSIDTNHYVSQSKVIGLTDTLTHYAYSSHAHAISNITGLQDSLNKFIEYPDTTNLIAMQWELDGKASASHTHTIGNITSLQDSLNIHVRYADSSGTLGWYRRAHTDALINAKVSDAAYGAGWNGVTTIAPSKNAVYDQIGLLVTDIEARELLYTDVYIDGDSPDLTGSTNCWIEQTAASAPSIIFYNVTTAGITVYVKVITINALGSVTLDFQDLLNGADANPVLTVANNGAAYMFKHNGTYWYQLSP